VRTLTGSARGAGIAPNGLPVTGSVARRTKNVVLISLFEIFSNAWLTHSDRTAPDPVRYPGLSTACHLRWVLWSAEFTGNKK
jgi:hypothetical protein